MAFLLTLLILTNVTDFLLLHDAGDSFSAIKTRKKY